jgi:hypothetical protein
MVKGQELSVAIVPDCLSRFAISEVRVYNPDGFPDRAYAVRDASSVSDAEVRAGKRSRVVARFPDEAAAVAYCRAQT